MRNATLLWAERSWKKEVKLAKNRLVQQGHFSTGMAVVYEADELTGAGQGIPD